MLIYDSPKKYKDQGMILSAIHMNLADQAKKAANLKEDALAAFVLI